MDEEKKDEQQPGYTPRPASQVWLARIGLVIFIGLVIVQIVNMARGAL